MAEKGNNARQSSSRLCVWRGSCTCLSGLGLQGWHQQAAFYLKKEERVIPIDVRNNPYLFQFMFEITLISTDGISRISNSTEACLLKVLNQPHTILSLKRTLCHPYLYAGALQSQPSQTAFGQSASRKCDESLAHRYPIGCDGRSCSLLSNRRWIKTSGVLCFLVSANTSEFLCFLMSSIKYICVLGFSCECTVSNTSTQNLSKL